MWPSLQGPNWEVEVHGAALDNNFRVLADTPAPGLRTLAHWVTDQWFVCCDGLWLHLQQVLIWDLPSPVGPVPVAIGLASQDKTTCLTFVRQLSWNKSIETAIAQTARRP